MNSIYLSKREIFLVKSTSSYTIVFCNVDIICFYKKKYLLTYQVNSLFTRSNFISFLISRCSFINYNLPRFGLINRLDYLSTGILVFCRNLSSYRYYISLYKKKLIIKYYITIVNGLFPTTLSSCCSSYLFSRRIVKKPGYIVTNFTRVSYFISGSNYYSLLLCSTNTGRYHQIRDQLKFEGYGIISDNRNCKKKYFFLQFFMLSLPYILIKIPFDFLLLNLISRFHIYKKFYF
ncbi:pseudouridine synthase [Candidatus Vidania fulgoroideorum]